MKMKSFRVVWLLRVDNADFYGELPFNSVTDFTPVVPDSIRTFLPKLFFCSLIVNSETEPTSCEILDQLQGLDLNIRFPETILQTTPQVVHEDIMQTTLRTAGLVVK